MGIEAVKTAWLLLPVAAACVAQTPDREVPFDNTLVRVVQVHRAMPGVKTRPHQHDINRVMIYLNSGGQTVTWEGGQVEKQTWKAGEALWSPRGGIHVAEITGAEPARIVEVELKGEGPAAIAARSPRDPEVADPKHFSVDFANAQVRVVRLRLAAGEQTLKLEHGKPRITTYLTAQEVEINGKRETRRAGQVDWRDPGAEAIRNPGPGAVEAIFIYLN